MFRYHQQVGGCLRPRLRTRGIDGLPARASAPRSRVGWRLPTPYRSGTTAHCLMECCFTAPRAEPRAGATGDEHRRRHAAVRADQAGHGTVHGRHSSECKAVEPRHCPAAVGDTTRRGDLVAHAGGARRLVVEHREGGGTRSADEAALRERFGYAPLVRGRRPAGRPTRPAGALRGHGETAGPADARPDATLVEGGGPRHRPHEKGHRDHHRYRVRRRRARAAPGGRSNSAASAVFASGAASRTGAATPGPVIGWTCRRSASPTSSPARS